MNRTQRLLTIALVVFTVAAGDAAPKASRDLRDSARRILADPEFRNFEHFADDAFQKKEASTSNAAEPQPSSQDGANASDRKASEPSNSNTPAEAEPWWQKALNRTQPSDSSSKSGSSRKQRLSPAGSSQPSGSDSRSSGENSDQSGTSMSQDQSGATPSSQNSGRRSTGSAPNAGADSDGMGTSSNPSPSDTSPSPNSGDPSSKTKPSAQTSDGSSSNKNGSRTASRNEPTGQPTSPRTNSESTAKDTTGSRKNVTTPSADQANSQPANTKTAAKTPSRTETEKSPPTRNNTERPTRTSRTATPSQRGSDGVERPVRQASRSPRAPKVEPSSGPQWEAPSFAFGNLLGGLFHGLAYLILAVIVVAIVVLIAQALMQAWTDRARRSSDVATSIVGPLTHDRSPGETESDVFLREALALAQRGEYRAAIGRLVLGGMSFIERQQWIRYRRGLTVHDYLRVLRSRPDQFAAFRQVVHVFEPVEYGRRLATEPLFTEALQGYRQGFDTNRDQPGEVT